MSSGDRAGGRRALTDSTQNTTPGPARAIQVIRRIFADQLTPVLAYRRLVAPDDRTAPSFLFESVEQDGGVGRHSIVGVRPRLEVVGRGDELMVIDHDPRDGMVERGHHGRDPFELVRELRGESTPIAVHGDGSPPDAFHAGFVGFASYDSARWAEPEKLPFEKAPSDDRGLPDLHLGLYGRVLVFDHVAKTVFVVATELVRDHVDLDSAVIAATGEADELVRAVADDSVHLAAGTIDLDLDRPPRPPVDSSMTRPEFEAAVERTREYIAAGDAFQVVLSQRFERTTEADPFDLYRACGW